MLAVAVACTVMVIDVLDRLLIRAPEGVYQPATVAQVLLSPAGEPPRSLIDYSTSELLDKSQAVSSTAVYFEESLSFDRGRAARLIQAVSTTPRYFEVLGVAPFLGAWALPTEDGVVISHRLWRQKFEGASDVIGKTMPIGKDVYAIVAVAPPGFSGTGLRPADVWLPLERRASTTFGPTWKTSALFLRAVVRLNATVSMADATTELNGLLQAASLPAARPIRLELARLRRGSEPAGPAGNVRLVAVTLAVLLLMAASANAANIIALRSLGRRSEIMMKTALGATRSRLIVETICEAALLALLSATMAVATYSFVAPLVLREFGAVDGLRPDLRTLLITGVVTAFSAALVSLGPAAVVTGTTKAGWSLGHRANGGTRLISAFVAFQVAVSLPIVVTAILYTMSFVKANQQDFGMRPEGVVAITTDLGADGRQAGTHGLVRSMQEKLVGVPGVLAMAVVETLPFGTRSSLFIEVPGRDLSWMNSEQIPGVNFVDSEFFDLMGMRLTRGRLFTAEENTRGGPSVAVITESMAGIIWPSQDPLGKCFYINNSSNGRPCTSVVGVIADARLAPSARPTSDWSAHYYVPVEQRGRRWPRTLLVRRTEGNVPSIETLRQVVASIDGQAPFVEVSDFGENFATLFAPWRQGMLLCLFFAAVGTVVSIAGTAVVVAYAASGRRRELAIRQAIGATEANNVLMLVRSGAGIVALGVSGGGALVSLAMPLVSPELFDRNSSNLDVVLGSAALLVAIYLTVVAAVSFTNGRVSPADVLRAE